MDSATRSNLTAFDAAAIGSQQYVRVEDLSKSEISNLQIAYTDDIIDGLNKCVASRPSHWRGDRAAIVLIATYNSLTWPHRIDLSLNKSDFPYVASSDSGKAFHTKMLKTIQDHWQDITRK